MLPARDFEKKMGIEWYITDTPGIGGKLRKTPEDFVVEENVSLPPGDGFLAVKIRSRNTESNTLKIRLMNTLGLREREISFPGIKDRRAVSTHWFTIKTGGGPREKKILEKLGKAHIEGVDILAIEKCGRHLRTGEHLGNTFTIAIRDITVAQRDALEIAEQVFSTVENIFANYFGIQRFGSVRPVTHEIGKALVREDFERAVRTLCGEPGKSGPKEKEFREKAMRAESDSDWEEVYLLIPHHLIFEKTVAGHLSNYPGDYLGALQRLPPFMLRFYIHSYQSYLFNRILSERISRGLSYKEPLIGDLVEPSVDRIKGGRARFIPVTQTNIGTIEKRIQEGRAWITGVLPGTGTPLAEGEMGEIERKIMEEEKISEKMFNITGLREAHTRGNRRPIHITAEEPSVQEAQDSGGGGNAIIVKFKLRSGGYATTILREIMKCEEPLCY